MIRDAADMTNEKKTQQPKIRKCLVLRETEAALSELKEGDIFRVEGSSKFFVAVKDSIPDGQPGNYVIDAEEIAFARCFSAETLSSRLTKAIQLAPAPAVEQSKKVVKLKGKNK